MTTQSTINGNYDAACLEGVALLGALHGLFHSMPAPEDDSFPYTSRHVDDMWEIVGSLRVAVDNIRPVVERD